MTLCDVQAGSASVAVGLCVWHRAPGSKRSIMQTSAAPLRV